MMRPKFEHCTMMFKYPDDKNRLLDGRPVRYIANEVNFNREYMALIIKGVYPATYSLAKRIVDRFKPGESVEDYFVDNREWE